MKTHASDARVRSGILAAALLLLSCGAASAQTRVGLGTMTWQANDGSGWTSDRIVTTQPSVMIRILAAWEDRPDVGYMFAGSQFDVAVTTAHLAADQATDMSRPGWFRTGRSQTIAATRFGSVLKIDDSRDTLGPGMGSNGVFPGQLVEAFGGPFDHSNPAHIFEFRLTFDDVPGERHVTSLYVPSTGGNTIDRVMRTYTTESGAQNMPSTTTFALDIVYVPGPGAAAVLGAAGIMVGRRRRRG